MLYFLKEKKKQKKRKIAAALKAKPPNPHWPPAAGGSAPRPQTPELLLTLPVILIFQKAFVALTSLIYASANANIKKE